MCYEHWSACPRKLRERVWDAFKHEGVLSEEYHEARDAAVMAVTPQGTF
jgi:hypothetical protein